jgi:hypothetical protein
LERVSEAHGKTADEAWQAVFADLKRKGVMPDNATE